MNTVHSIRRDFHGFTLMELVLAMGICAIVLAAINAVFFSALRLRAVTIQAVDETLPVQQALATLRRDLQCAMSPVTNGMLSGDFKVGDVTSLGLNQNVNIELYTTTGALHENEPWAEIQRVTYELRPSAAGASAPGKDLVRSVTRNLLSTIIPTPDDQRMMGNVASMDLDCYDGTQWRNTWDTTAGDTNLPMAVRVKIQLAENGGGVSPNQQPIVLVVPMDTQSRTNLAQGTTN